MTSGGSEVVTERLMMKVLGLAAVAFCRVAAGEPDIQARTDRWRVDETGVVWDVDRDVRLPHGDWLEMSGRGVSALFAYDVAADRSLTIVPTVLFPKLRLPIPGCSNALVHVYSPEDRPHVTIDGRPVGERVSRISYDGVWTASAEAAPGLALTRRFFPAVGDCALFEALEITNTGRVTCVAALSGGAWSAEAAGVKGIYVYGSDFEPKGSVTLKPGGHVCWGIRYGARLKPDPVPVIDALAELDARRKRIAEIVDRTVLETGVPEFDREFRLAKLRAAESVFDTSAGLMHSPGGGKFYTSTWCNDQLEYAAPWFAMTGDEIALEASLNAFRQYMRRMKDDYSPIPSAVFAEDTVVWRGAGDRGDAAMFASGAARFALSCGRRVWAEELWPGIRWSLEFCRRRLTEDGVVASDSDELEGRYPTGTANLNTSCLYFDALRHARFIARDLGEERAAADYARQASELEAAVERHFAATIHGFETYRYFDGCRPLRSWIGTPLCVGIRRRAEGTVAALFSHYLWTGSEVLVSEDDTAKVIWDRSLLYAIRGVFAAGKCDCVLPYLQAYTHNRLRGEHVPYPIEQWPTRRGAHLSAESALYCRIFTEGLFGIRATGLGSFNAEARLPKGWARMALRKVHAFGQVFDIEVDRRGTRILASHGGSGVK